MMTIQFYDKGCDPYEDPYHKTEYHLEWSVSNAQSRLFLIDKKSL
jgi:hypothetical protein